MSFLSTLKKFAEWRDLNRPSISNATVEVTEKHARRALHIPKGEPLVWRGLSLRCIGSKRWRADRAEERWEVEREKKRASHSITGDGA